MLARLAIHGTTSDIKHQTFITIYADIDRVDFDFRIDKPVTTREQRLCHAVCLSREGDADQDAEQHKHAAPV